MTISLVSETALAGGTGPAAFGAPSGAPLVYGFGVHGDVGLLAVGVFCLYLGAEALVEGASRVAIDFGLDAAIVGVTVVAFGTTTPELFVGLFSTLDYSSALGIGAIVGSNIANIGLVLGVAAIIRPFSVNQTTLRRHVPFMIVAMLFLVGLGFDQTLSRLDGVLFLLLLGGFMLFLVRESDGGDTVPTDPGAIVDEANTGSNLRNACLIAVGLVVLFVGSRSLIVSGRSLLQTMGFSSRFIGLTVLAFGTSLPELAASVVSAIRGKAAFSLGNVVGSNIYNILAVLGLLAVLVPLGVPSNTITYDFPALILFSVGLVALLAHDPRVTRTDGLLLVGSYGVFIAFLA